MQFGSFGSDQIFAWTGSVDGGYSWKETPGKPRLGVKFDVASGDRNPTDGRQETFDPLFFKSGYFNDASLLRPSNVIDIHPSFSVEPGRRLEVSGGVDVFFEVAAELALTGAQALSQNGFKVDLGKHSVVRALTLASAGPQSRDS